MNWYDGDYYNMKTVQSALGGLHRQTVMKLVNSGEIIAWQPLKGSPWRFNIDSVNDYYNRQHKNDNV